MANPINLQDLQALSLGTITPNVANAGAAPAAGTVCLAPVNPTPAIPCTIAPNNSVAFNLANVNCFGDNDIQFNCTNGSIPCTLFLVAGALGGNIAGTTPPTSTAQLYDYWDTGATQSAFDPGSTFTANGEAQGLPIQQLSKTLWAAGGLLTGVQIQSNIGIAPATPAVIGQNNTLLMAESLTQINAPIDPNDSSCNNVEYAPWCDCCTFNQRNNIATNCWTFMAPVTNMQGIAIPFPAFTSARIGFSWASFGVMNTDQVTANTGVCGA